MPIEPLAVVGVTIVQEATGADLFFDATVEERHSKNATITEHPVEDGSDITDHVDQAPDGLVLTGVFTNTPFESIDPAPVPERRRVLYEQLVQFKRDALPLIVFTRPEIYSNMLISRVDLTVTPDTGQQYVPVVELRQITIASQIEVPVPPEILAQFAKSSGQSETDNGKQGAANSTAAERAAGGSALSALDDVFGGGVSDTVSGLGR